jgi:tetratricopeptide (TPR) repeat protein
MSMPTPACLSIDENRKRVTRSFCRKSRPWEDVTGEYAMKHTKKAGHVREVRVSPMLKDLPGVLLGILALSLFLSAAVRNARAESAGSHAAAHAQEVGKYLDEEEIKAYDEAKKEPDPQKRALKLLEFLQKYPKSPLMEVSDFEEVRKIEGEYNAYYAARQEPDPGKRASLLIQFLQKYPKSTIGQNIDYEYVKILKETAGKKDWELLESLSEQWLKVRPEEKEAYVLLAEATMNLKKYDRCAEALEAVYKMQPDPKLAREILATYEKTKNTAKQLEWAEMLFKMPEFDADYMLRYGFVTYYLENKDLAKATEFSQLTLKSADLAEQKDPGLKEKLRKVRRACYHVMASYLMDKGNYAAAISSFKKAIESESYAQGYYDIGLCLEKVKKVDEALVYYAAAETMGGEDAPRAKSRLEVLYRALHNDTLIGIEKIYSKAKELLGESRK